MKNLWWPKILAQNPIWEYRTSNNTSPAVSNLIKLRKQQNTFYNSSSSSIFALLSAALFLTKMPHLRTAFSLSQLTTAFPDERIWSSSSSKQKFWGVNGVKGENPKFSFTLNAECPCPPPMLDIRSRCCMSSVSSISWLLARISSTGMSSKPRL